MNTNRINNKNLKRIAIAAGTTAAALFLSAGLVACDSKASDTVAGPTQAAELVEALENVAAQISPTVDEAVEVQSEVLPALETTTKSAAQPESKSKKASKKKSAAVGGSVILDAPTVSESAPAVETTVAPAPQQADNTAVTTPAAQPAVEQPATQQQPTATASAPASSGSTTAISVPKLTMTDSVSSALKGVDLTKLTSPISVPQICIPGYNC